MSSVFNSPSSRYWVKVCIISCDSIGWKLDARGSVDALVVLGAAGFPLEVGAVAAAGEEADAAVVLLLTLAATDGLG